MRQPWAWALAGVVVFLSFGVGSTLLYSGADEDNVMSAGLGLEVGFD